MINLLFVVITGPFTKKYKVFDSFLALILPTNLNSGVYQHVSGAELGGHAVKMIGWGTENGTPYWLISNSWNTDWGDHGQY